MELNSINIVFVKDRAELLSVRRDGCNHIWFARDEDEAVDKVEVMVIRYAFE
jgi:hypothetical protein